MNVVFIFNSEDFDELISWDRVKIIGVRGIICGVRGKICLVRGKTSGVRGHKWGQG